LPVTSWESSLFARKKSTARLFSGLLRDPLLLRGHENNHWFIGAVRQGPAPSCLCLWLQACHDRVSPCPGHFRGMPQVQRHKDVSRRRVRTFQVAHQIAPHDSGQPETAPSRPLRGPLGDKDPRLCAGSLSRGRSCPLMTDPVHDLPQQLRPEQTSQDKSLALL